MDAITERQEEYLQILSSYEATEKEDKRDIETYLNEHNKNAINQLSKKEASELIQILLQRPTEYVFHCGKKAVLHKQEVNSFHVLGDMEGCMHACPDETIGGDVNNCPYWKKTSVQSSKSQLSSRTQHAYNRKKEVIVNIDINDEEEELVKSLIEKNIWWKIWIELLKKDGNYHHFQRWLRASSNPNQCFRCGTKENLIKRGHHLVYKPIELIVPCCKRCHFILHQEEIEYGRVPQNGNG